MILISGATSSWEAKKYNDLIPPPVSALALAQISRNPLEGSSMKKSRHQSHRFSFSRLSYCLSDDLGTTISVELVLVATVLLIGLIVAQASLRDGVIGELSDVSSTVQNLNQSYSTNGVVSGSASVGGSSFEDSTDVADDGIDPSGLFGSGIVLNGPIDEGDALAGSAGGAGTGGTGTSGTGGTGGTGTGGTGTGGTGTGGTGTGGTGGTTPPDDFGTPADGILFSDNFQDGNGNAPFNLQVRNTQTDATTPWRAVIPAAPYETIPGLNSGAFTLVTTDNGDGTFQHVFTGTADLGISGSSTQSVIITGGTPSPAGVGGAGNLLLFIP